MSVIFRGGRLTSGVDKTGEGVKGRYIGGNLNTPLLCVCINHRTWSNAGKGAIARPFWDECDSSGNLSEAFEGLPVALVGVVCTKFCR